MFKAIMPTWGNKFSLALFVEAFFALIRFTASWMSQSVLNVYGVDHPSLRSESDENDDTNLIVYVVLIHMATVNDKLHKVSNCVN